MAPSTSSCVYTKGVGSTAPGPVAVFKKVVQRAAFAPLERRSFCGGNSTTGSSFGTLDAAERACLQNSLCTGVYANANARNGPFQMCTGKSFLPSLYNSTVYEQTQNAGCVDSFAVLVQMSHFDTELDTVRRQLNLRSCADVQRVCSNVAYEKHHVLLKNACPKSCGQCRPNTCALGSALSSVLYNSKESDDFDVQNLVDDAVVKVLGIPFTFGLTGKLDLTRTCDDLFRQYTGPGTPVPFVFADSWIVSHAE